jgi:hypothetical protein
MSSEHSLGGANAARAHDDRRDFADAGRLAVIAVNEDADAR